METVLVNETAEDVWFDDFSISRTPSIVIQETNRACPEELRNPWGLELTGLGYQNGGVKENKYLYNGKELIVDNDLQYYDDGARMYDPMIGRWTSSDPMASEREWLSPYNYVQNNPTLRVDPDGMLDEFNYNVYSGEIGWVSDLGGDEVQFVNVVNDEGKRLGRGSVSGSEVYVYKLRESVVLTNFDAEFDDRSYNRKNGYEYSIRNFQLRKEYKKSENVFGQFIDKAERTGKAIPISSMDEDLHYGHFLSRYRMMKFAVENGLMLADPIGKSFKLSGSRYFSNSGIIGAQGVKALSKTNNSWNSFLKANKGKYSGSGWQKKAAADYYKSSYYKK